MSLATEFKKFREDKLKAEFLKFREEKRQGIVGPEGPIGSTGLQGSQGLPGVSVTGSMGPIGLKGERGLEGLSGAPGPIGVPGPKGDPGMKGDTGLIGLSPNHEWRGEELRFMHPDGTWGKWVDFRGPISAGAGTGGGGGSTLVSQVINISSSFYSITRSELVAGITIFSFSFDGDVTVVLPKRPGKDRLIELRHEDDTKSITTFVTQ